MATSITRTVPDTADRPFMQRPHIMRERGVWVVYWVARIPVPAVLDAARWSMATLGYTQVRYGDPF